MTYRISGSGDCDHESLFHVGSDSGDNDYFRCDDCGAVIIEESKSEPEDKMEPEPDEAEKDAVEKLVDKLIND